MSGSIIRFPSGKTRKKRMTDVLVDRLTDGSNHAHLGDISFTCVECHSVTNVNFTRMIFRSISFYCSGCGHAYLMTNPLFAQQVRPKGRVQDGNG